MCGWEKESERRGVWFVGGFHRTNCGASAAAKGRTRLKKVRSMRGHSGVWRWLRNTSGVGRESYQELRVQFLRSSQEACSDCPRVCAT